MLEGIATVLLSFMSWYYLPADIATAPFLTPEEREFARTFVSFWGIRATEHTCVVSRFRMDLGSPAIVESPTQDLRVSDDIEKRELAQSEQVEIKEAIVADEDEKFEWGEVIRGQDASSVTVSGINWHLGITDIQVWLTGVSYFGVLVSLYSYSLFLSVCRNHPFSSLMTLLGPVSSTILGMKDLLLSCIRVRESSNDLLVQTNSLSSTTLCPSCGHDRFVASITLSTCSLTQSVVVVAVLSDRLKWRGPFVLIFLPVSIVGKFFVLIYIHPL